MAVKCFTVGLLFVLLATAATTDAKKSKKGGPSWFFPGGTEEVEESGGSSGHGIRSLRNEINQLEAQNNGVLVVKLASKQNNPKMSNLATHWTSLLNSVNVKIDTFVLSEDKLIVKIAEESKALVPDVKQFLLDEHNVLDVSSLGEKNMFASSENDADINNENAENEMEGENGELEN